MKRLKFGTLNKRNSRLDLDGLAKDRERGILDNFEASI